MALVSYVFTVNPGRQAYYLPGVNNLEVKSVAATNLEVVIADSSTLTNTCTLFRNDVRLGTSIPVGPNSAVGFQNVTGKPTQGYLGANL
jgi:hypothetical protein